MAMKWHFGTFFRVISVISQIIEIFQYQSQKSRVRFGSDFPHDKKREMISYLGGGDPNFWIII